MNGFCQYYIPIKKNVSKKNIAEYNLTINIKFEKIDVFKN